MQEVLINEYREQDIRVSLIETGKAGHWRKLRVTTNGNGISAIYKWNAV